MFRYIVYVTVKCHFKSECLKSKKSCKRIAALTWSKFPFIFLFFFFIPDWIKAFCANFELYRSSIRKILISGKFSRKKCITFWHLCSTSSFRFPLLSKGSPITMDSTGSSFRILLKKFSILSASIVALGEAMICNASVSAIPHLFSPMSIAITFLMTVNF
jgi:hypothetical protein